MYVAPVGRLISYTGIDFHQYADDINIYTSLSSSSADLTQLTLCTSSLQHWLWHNGPGATVLDRRGKQTGAVSSTRPHRKTTTFEDTLIRAVKTGEKSLRKVNLVAKRTKLSGDKGW